MLCCCGGTEKCISDDLFICAKNITCIVKMVVNRFHGISIIFCNCTADVNDAY